MITVRLNLIYTFLTHATLCWVHNDCLKNQQNSPVAGVKDYVLIGIPFFVSFCFFFFLAWWKNLLWEKDQGGPAWLLDLRSGEKRNAKLVLIKMLPIGNEWYCQEKKKRVFWTLCERNKGKKNQTASLKF